MFTLNTPIQHSIESPCQNIQARKRNKGLETGNEEAKLSLFADDMILYIYKILEAPQKTVISNQ